MPADAIQPVPCKDIEPRALTNQEVTLAKVPKQADYETFADWIRNEARKYCRGAYCTKGNCHGHAEISEWDIVDTTADAFTVKYSAELVCRCE